MRDTRIGRGAALTTMACAALLASAPAALARGHRQDHRDRRARAAQRHHAHPARRHRSARSARRRDRNGHRGRRGHAAHTLSGTETAHLHLLRQRETHLYEQGAASGPLPGSMSAELTVGARFTGRFTIHTRHGSITGHGSAQPHGSGRYQSFRGTMYVSRGSGRYKHVHGRTQLYGTFDRRTFDVVLHTKGRLSY